MNLRPDSDRPVTIGHEGVGHIESMGAEASDHGFAIGDAIGFNYITGCCFTCGGCQVHNLQCETGNQKVQGFGVDGFFAEYAVVEWQNAVKLPANLEMRRAAPLFCAGITAFHSVDSCELEPGMWLAVVGCGGLGQYAVQYAKAVCFVSHRISFCSSLLQSKRENGEFIHTDLTGRQIGIKTIAHDMNDSQLAMAKKLGADATFNSKTNTNYIEDIKKLTDGKGCHAAAVYSGSNIAYAGAPNLLRAGGLLMVIGIAPKGLDFINTFDLTTGRYRIKADSTGIPQRMQKAVDFTGKHGIQPEVEYRTLEDLPRMVEEMQQGKAEKRQVVVF